MANLTGNQIRHTYERVVQIDPASRGSRGMLQDGFGRPLSASIKALTVSESLNVGGNTAITGSTNIQGSLTVNSNGTVLGNLTVGGRVTAEEFITTTVSSSVIYQSGSTKFGDTIEDTHQVTGSLLVTGSVTTVGTNESTDGEYGAFFANPQILTRNIVIPATYNSRLFGPITVAQGKTLTVGANAKLEITDI